jgi:transcriptional regulator with XRE-family HTH domain
MPVEINVGQSIRDLRLRQDLSIRELAGRSGLSVNTLSLIENGRTSPTVGTLQQLAAALDVPVAAFFPADANGTRVVHIRSGKRRRAALGCGTIENLGVGFMNPAIQPFMVILEPKAGSGPHPIVHKGSEFVLCLRGRIAYRIEDRAYPLRQGESLLFESHLPHSWQNTETSSSQFLLILFPSDLNDQAKDRHFASGRRRR